MRNVKAQLTATLELIEPGQRPRWIFVVVLAVLASVFEAVGAVLIYSLLGLVNDPSGPLELPLLGDLRERFPGVSNDTIIGGFAVLMAVFFLLRAGILVLQAVLQNRTAQDAGVRLSRRLISGYLRLPYAFHLTRNSSESIRNAVTSTSELVAYVLLPTVMLLSEALVVLALVAVMLIVAPVATLMAVLVLAPLVLVLLRVVQPRLTRMGQQAQDAHQQSLQSIQQALQGVREIKVLGKEAYFAQQFTRIRGLMAEAQANRAALTEVPRVAIETSLLLLIVGFLGITVLTGDSVKDSITVLGLFGYAALRVMPGLNRAVTQLNTLRYGAPALAIVLADLRLVGSLPTDDPHRVEPLPFRKCLKATGLSFRYASGNRDALTDVDLEIRRGESIGIIGPTGSGKSTLVDLLLGLLEPSAGQVTCDGVDVRTALAAWQRNIGVVPQNVFMLDESLRRNIALGLQEDEIDDEAVAEAVRLAQLEDVVEELPDGLDTIVGEQGIRLSGGQRQRVAIARALYHRPAVLLFDEGTSALDVATEAEFARALEHLRGQRTILTVAHRLSTVENCDRVILVRDGRIADAGPFYELASRHAELRGSAEKPLEQASEL